MGSPPEPAAPPAPPPAPPAGGPAPGAQPPAAPPAPPNGQPPAPPAPAPDSPEGKLARAEAALDQERAQHRTAQQELARLRREGMTDQERLVAEARQAGKAEALQAAGLQVAAAEFRALAAGKLADPAAALEDLNLARFVGEDGTVNKRSLAAMVDRLAAAAAPLAPKPGSIPGGPHGATGETDFIRQAMGQRG
jgi:flagellar biosynthesis/type III secretory pathway protein FliH